MNGHVVVDHATAQVRTPTATWHWYGTRAGRRVRGHGIRNHHRTRVPGWATCKATDPDGDEPMNKGGTGEGHQGQGVSAGSPPAPPTQQLPSMTSRQRFRPRPLPRPRRPVPRRNDRWPSPRRHRASAAHRSGHGTAGAASGTRMVVTCGLRKRPAVAVFEFGQQTVHHVLACQTDLPAGRSMMRPAPSGPRTGLRAHHGLRWHQRLPGDLSFPQTGMLTAATPASSPVQASVTSVPGQRDTARSAATATCGYATKVTIYNCRNNAWWSGAAMRLDAAGSGWTAVAVGG